MYDYILKHGKIMDGTNNPWYYSDVGIKDGHIAEISCDITESATKIIDVSGLQ